jgi:LmbE family N-acetylglucosaminyl deacetylase
VRLSIIAVLVASAAALAQPLPPDERFTTDILLIVAHPDDETVAGGYLARAIFDEHRRVSAIFATRGDGGGNAQGVEQAASLGAIRDVEARRALAHFGVTNVWILGAPDTPGQNVLRSLETWHHGERLAEVVRIIRLTRPKVVMTWLPAYVAGENHGDHQAAGVIATEAFDLAGDPAAFPEQIAAPRSPRGISNLTEGLHPWQAQKLYYFTDASHFDFIEHKGPVYPLDSVSPARGVPYYRLAAEESAFHLTQSDTGQAAKRALGSGDFHDFSQPVRMVLGKCHVDAPVTADVFGGVAERPIGFAPPARRLASPHNSPPVELGGPWAFYREFWLAHDINPVALAPEVAISAGADLWIPIVLHNNSDEPQSMKLTALLPAGWTAVEPAASYTVPRRSSYAIELRLKAPSRMQAGWSRLAIEARSGPHVIVRVSLRAQLTAGSLPQ